MLPMFQNPQSMAIKKHIFDMIKEKYIKNEKFIERLTTYVTTKEDYESFGSLLVDVYEAGFMRALDQYKEQLAKMGMTVNVIPEQKQNASENNKIFR